jgi:hypothetical protein
MMQHFAATCSDKVVSCSGLPQSGANNATITTILGVVFAMTASIAVLIIVIAGLRYIIARGDPKAVAQARNTITYAVVGLLISMAAFSIVTFVIKGAA